MSWLNLGNDENRKYKVGDIVEDKWGRKGKYDNDNIITEKYKDLKSCNKVAIIFNTTGENIRQVLIRNNVERK